MDSKNYSFGGEPDGYAPGIGEYDGAGNSSTKMKKIAKQMKSKGRFGDSELVHVNPAEKKMLENMSGGIVTKNPDTGLDEHFWSILIPAAIGALTGAMNKGGLKGALKGALLGGATAGLGAGLGGMAGGEGFMTGLGTMFGGAGQGINGFGSLLGYGDTATAGGAVGTGAGYSAPIGPLNPSASGLGNVAMGAKSLSAAAPVGAVEQTLTGDIGKFLKTPQGLSIAASALGAITDDGKDPYADDIAKKKADDKNYVRYTGGMADNRFADGGPVSGAGGGKDDKIKAMLSDGEHVITADEVSMLGDGSNDAGHKKLYAMRKKLRKHKTGSEKQMPKAKSPESYAGIGA